MSKNKDWIVKRINHIIKRHEEKLKKYKIKRR